jgi:hypothetical protein
MTQAEIDGLDDDAWYRALAEARWLEKQDERVIANAFVMAIASMFKKR